MKTKNKIIVAVFILVVIMVCVITGIKINSKNIAIVKEKDKIASNNKIYNTIVSSASYSVDPKNPENILNGINRHIVRIKVVGVEDAEFLPTTEYYNNPYNPCTPIKVEILENLYGEEIKPTNNKIYIAGGDVRLSDLAERLDDVDLTRLGLNELTREEKENQYMRYETEFTYNMQQDKEYVVIVAEIGNGLYKIVEEGCGIFVEDSSSDAMSKKAITGISLKNVITNDKIEQETLVEKAKEKKVEINEINKANNDINK